MDGFDREALVAAANGQTKSDSNIGFWATVMALPIIGAAIGAYFLAADSQKSPAAPFEISVISETVVEEKPVGVASAKTSTAQGFIESSIQSMEVRAGTRAADKNAPWSAAAEMGRFRLASRAISDCYRPGNYDSTVRTSFNDRNAAAYEKLKAIDDAEWKAGRSERYEDMKRYQRDMMIGLITGETQREAMEMSLEFQRDGYMFPSIEADLVKKTDPMVLALLGGEPDLANCTKLKIDIQRGKYDIKFEKRS